jgi:hypothetical protein
MTLPIQTQLASISPYLIRVWYFNDATQTWIYYDPYNLPGSVLQQLVDGYLYYITVSTSCTISYTVGSSVYSFTLDSVSPSNNIIVWTPTMQGQPIALIWETSMIPDSYKSGTYVLISVTLKNTGSGAGILASGLYTTDPDISNWESGYTFTVQPDNTDTVLVGFTMPAHDVVFCLIARHKDSQGNWVTDQIQPAITVHVAPAGTGPAHPVLMGIANIPTSANSGSTIQMQININNDGGSWGAVRALIRSSDIVVTPTYSPDWLELQAYPVNGYQGIQTVTFTMPDSNVTFYIDLYHWNYTTGQWIKDSDSGPYNITRTGSQPTFAWVGESYN